ncbi:hypothetical protein BS50DRAFT_631125 [Corynespora cassiicola Philippines]|uniref:Uncharacterized protein n=1 Tax=Corynespora cassiicola Philippines TaxID=1448308 RepID=A0A2T2P0E7_CORCC|nr:hypothetical protein BS50DRAFT_631125 [Corynespora cassiicola Philippines]
MYPVAYIAIVFLVSVHFTLSTPFGRTQIPSCQYPSLTTSTYIYFTTPTDPNFLFSIKTPWTNFYDDDLRGVLPMKGFQLSPMPSSSRDEICGWRHVESVTVTFIYHGDISYRPKYTAETPLRLMSRNVDRFVNISRHAAHSDHQRTVPLNETLARIHNLLYGYSPDKDIIILLCEILIPILLFCLAYFLVLLVFKYFIDKDEENKQNELNEMQSYSMERLGGTESNGPINDPQRQTVPKAIYDGRVQTPLPSYTSSVYSRDENGH